MTRKPDPPLPNCPWCTSDNVELQVASAVRETYLCNTCSKLFVMPKRRMYEG